MERAKYRITHRVIARINVVTPPCTREEAELRATQMVAEMIATGGEVLETTVELEPPAPPA